MICPKCGKAMNDNDIFCPNCGGKAERNDLNAGTAVPARGMEKLGDNKVPFFASLIFQVLSLFAVGGSMIRISYEVFFSERTMEMTLFESNPKLSVLFYAGYVLGIVAMIAPVLFEISWNKLSFAAAMGMPILVALWFLYVVAGAKNEVANGVYAEIIKLADISVSISGNAFYFIIISLLQFFATYKASYDIIKTQEYVEKKNQNNRAEDKKSDILDQDSVVCSKCGHRQKKGSAICESCYAPMFKL